MIGILKVRNRFELVVYAGEKTLDTINITDFGAIQSNYCLSKRVGQLHLFPDDKNMNDMLDNPFEWSRFMAKFD